MYTKGFAMPKVSFPESSFVRNTFTIRKMDLPPSVQMTKRSMLRWFALSFGLLSEQESRATVLDVLDALFYFLMNKQQNPSTKDIQTFILDKTNKTVSEKLIRYHLRRLMEVNILLRKSNRYHFNNSPTAEPNNLKESFSHWIKTPVNESLSSIEGMIDKISDSYRQQQ